MRIAELTRGQVYRVRRAHSADSPAMTLETSQWHRRTPNPSNTERPFELYLRNDQPAVGYSEPGSNKVGVPVLTWTRAPFYGEFGDAERRALQIAAASARLRFECARIAVDARQLREVIEGVVDADVARFLSVEVVAPRLLYVPESEEVASG